jgi:hypothetical protein
MDDSSERFSLSLIKLQKSSDKVFIVSGAVSLSPGRLCIFNQTEALLVVELYSDGFIVLPELKYNRYLCEMLSGEAHSTGVRSYGSTINPSEYTHFY